MPADLDRCVQHLLNDPDFSPDEGRTKEESAFAVCRANLNLSTDGAEDKLELGLTDDQIKRLVARHALDQKRDRAVFYHEIEFGGWDEILPNGDAIKKLPMLELGKNFINGDKTFDVLPEHISQAIKNFKKRKKAPLPITFGHQPDGSAPAAAWILDLTEGEDGRPVGTIQVLAETRRLMEEGKFKYFSAEFWLDNIDQKGNKVGFEFDGGAITNKPFFPSLRFDQSSSGTMLITLARYSHKDSEGDPTMADPIKPEIKDNKYTLTREQFDTLQRATEERDSIKAERDDLQSKLQQREKDLDRERTRNTANAIRDCIHRLQRDHGVVMQLGDFAIESSDSDCLAWLGTAPFGVTSLEGLQKLAKDTDMTSHLPKVKMGGEKSGGSDRLPPVDLTTEGGKAEAVRRRVAQLRRDFQSDELKFMLARRHQTIEDFAKMELAGEHGVKF